MLNSGRYSRQTLSVLAAMIEDPTAWRHGYELSKATALKSGTLYPILVRLSDRGLLTAKWEDAEPAGRPRRHLYRLTADGVDQAGEALRGGTDTPQRGPAGDPAGRRRTRLGAGRLAAQDA